MQRLPLEGIRVLDLTVALAGPWCTHILGALGAEVIKVEPIVGDETRRTGPPFWEGESPLFLAANSNKRSLAVELGSPEGREAALRLAAVSDVFVQNLRAGAVDRLGLAFDDVRDVNPTIVYCNMRAYGAVGPLASRPAYDLLMQAVGGIMSTTGEPDGPALRAGPPLVDLGTGMWAAIGILGALLGDRDEARLVDTSMYEAAVNFQPIQFVQHAATGEVAPRLGASGNILVPFETLPTSDGQIVVAAGNDRLFVKLVDAIGLSDLARDTRFSENAARVRNRAELAVILGRRFAERSTSEWIDILAAGGVPAGAVRDIGEIVADPQFDALGLFQAVAHEKLSDLRVLAPPVSYDGDRLRLRSAAPGLGSETREILAELGYERGSIDDLQRRGIVRASEAVPEDDVVTAPRHPVP
jgi:crotonobetainyl-CoA:carnitine CoA-transferase CaiB-like acyl-CoA transferase